jgi:hypothetical protein
MKKTAYLTYTLLLFTTICFADLADDLIQLKSLGLDDETIASSAAQSETKLQPSDLVKLKQAGFSNELIKKLLMPSKTETVPQAPQTIVIQQQNAPKGQVEITIHTHAAGGKIFIDGEFVANAHKGINKLNAPAGKRQLRIDHADNEYADNIEIDSSKPNVFYIYYFDEPNENSKKISDNFSKKYQRELTKLAENQFPTTLVDGDGFAVGKIYYTDITCSVYKTIKSFDKELTRIVFSGLKRKRINATKYSKERNYVDESKTIFFTYDLNDDLEIINEYISFKDIETKFQIWINSYAAYDRDMAQIEKFNNEANPENFKIVFSKKMLESTQGFYLKTYLSKSIYDFELKDKSYAICPIKSSYYYVWKRKGLDKEEKFRVLPDKKTVIAVHSNWLGNQTKVYHLNSSVDLTNITFDNVKSHL